MFIRKPPERLQKAVVVTYAQPASGMAVENLKREIEGLLIESGYEPEELIITVQDIPLHGSPPARG